MKPKYLIGDALNPKEVNGIVVIAHVCNDKRVMGAGIALAIAKKWPEVEDHYISAKTCKQGQVQLILVEPGVYVLNMIAQSLGKNSPSGIPLDYNQLDWCLEQAAIICDALNATLVGPRFGSALAGGDWEIIERLIEDKRFKNQPVIYDLPARK